MIVSPCRADRDGKCTLGKRPATHCRKKCPVLLTFKINSFANIGIMRAVNCESADYSIIDESC